jgi:hypothetical protein
VASPDPGQPGLAGRTQEYGGVRSETFLDIGALVLAAAFAS